jgi:sorting nexin-29
LEIKKVELLNGGKENEDPEIARRDAISVVDDGQCQLPTYEEVESNIQKLKIDKAPGEDNITAELIKYGGKAVTEGVHKLITLIWETEQTLDNWRISIICPILKKGDKPDCNDYRGITLLNTVYKVLSSVISEKLKIAIEHIFGEYQCGFRPNKSTINQLFIISQMMEKHYAHGIDLHLLTLHKLLIV